MEASQIYTWEDKIKSQLHYLGEEYLSELFEKIRCVLIQGYNKGILLGGANGIGKTFISQKLVESCPFKSVYINCRDSLDPSKEAKFSNAIKESFKKNPSTIDSNYSLIVLDDLNWLNNKSEEYSIIKEYLKSPDSSMGILLIGVGTSQKVPDELLVSGRLGYQVILRNLAISQREMLLNTILKPFINPETLKIISKEISLNTSNFTPADLNTMIKEIVTREVSNNEDFLTDRTSNLKLFNDNVEEILGKFNFFLRTYQPYNFKNELSTFSLKKNQNASFEKIYGMDTAKDELINILINPLKRNISEGYLKAPLPKGILIHGPPGTGKTMLCEALANSINITFLNLDCTQLRSKIVGETEQNITNLFQSARANSPTILCLEQMESLLPKRTESLDSTENSMHRILTCFLSELDGIYTRNTTLNDTVIVIGVTNFPSKIDPAILRPGRLDYHIYVGMPNLEQRIQILEGVLKLVQTSQPLTSNQIEEIAKLSEGISGAGLVSICREAALSALRENLSIEYVPYNLYLNCLKNYLNQNLSI